MRWRTIALACGVALAILAGAGRARAFGHCSFVGNTGVVFGAYDSLSPAPLDTAGKITVQCGGSGPGDRVVLVLSHGSSRSFTSRTLRGPDPRGLYYNLYLDAARSVIWGDGSGGSATVTVHPREGEAVSVDVYGRVPGAQHVRAGVYGDTIVVTMLF